MTITQWKYGRQKWFLFLCFKLVQPIRSIIYIHVYTVIFFIVLVVVFTYVGNIPNLQVFNILLVFTLVLPLYLKINSLRTLQNLIVHTHTVPHPLRDSETSYSPISEKTRMTFFTFFYLETGTNYIMLSLREMVNI